MKGSSRRKLMLKVISDHGAIAVRELIEQFAVSRMTIYRDLLQLKREARISRMHGGVIYSSSRGTERCRCCGRAVLPHQQVGRYCCPNCALVNDPDPTQLIYSDFISGKNMGAAECFFLLNCQVDICCHPTILAFARESDVLNFRSGFGGSIARLEEALEFLQIERVLTDPSADPADGSHSSP